MTRGITRRTAFRSAAGAGIMALTMVVFLGPGPAAAQLGEAGALDNIQTLMRTGDTQRALTRLKKHLKTPGLATAEIAKTYELMAYCYYTLGRPDVARRSFELLVKTSPEYTLDERLASTRALADFRAAQQAAGPEVVVGVKHDPPTGFEKTAPLTFTATLIDADKQVRSLRLYYRKQGGSEFGRVDLKRTTGETFTGTIPDPVLGPSPDLFILEYYLAAYDSGGKRVASAGGPRRLLSVPVDGRLALAKDARPEVSEDAGGLLSKWWFWTGVGVAAAGLGAGAYYGVRAATPPPATGAATVLLR